MLTSESVNRILVPIKDIIYPSDFDSQTMKSDIALALLAFAVNYSSRIQPVCLPEKPSQVKNGTWCWVTGWNRENSESGRWDGLMLQVDLSREGRVSNWPTREEGGKNTDSERIATMVRLLFLCQDLVAWVTAVMVSVQIRFGLG